MLGLHRGPSGRHGTQRAPPLNLREGIGIVPSERLMASDAQLGAFQAL